MEKKMAPDYYEDGKEGREMKLMTPRTGKMTKGKAREATCRLPAKGGSDINLKVYVGKVEKKAYELYEKRGRKAGHSMDDWLEAERIVRQRQRAF